MTLLEFLQEHGVDYREAGQHHHATLGWLNIECTYCSPDSGKYKLGISESGNTAHCWTCGKRDAVEALAEITRLEPRQIREQLYISFNRSTFTQDERRRSKRLSPLTLPQCVSEAILEPQRRYLESRGFDCDELREIWSIGSIGIAPRLSWRVYIPIHFHGKVVSWTTRSVSEKSPKRYINARDHEETLPAKSVLYGIDHVKHSVIVVEGPTDVWRIGKGSAATMSVNYTKEQISLLSDIPIRVVCFDSEKDAQKRALKLVRELSAYPGKTYQVVLETGKDPGSAKRSEIRELRARFLD